MAGLTAVVTECIVAQVTPRRGGVTSTAHLSRAESSGPGVRNTAGMAQGMRAVVPRRAVARPDRVRRSGLV